MKFYILSFIKFVVERAREFIIVVLSAGEGANGGGKKLFSAPKVVISKRS